MGSREEPAEVPVAAPALDQERHVCPAVERDLGARDRQHAERLHCVRELERAVDAVEEGVRRVAMDLDVAHASRVTWEELVADITAWHPLKESKMFGMPCLKRENGKVVAGYWKDGGLTVKLTDEAAREQALAIQGAELFDPAAQPPVRDSGPVEGV